MTSILRHSACFCHFWGNDTSVGFPIAIITATMMRSLECVLPSWQHSWFSLMSLWCQCGSLLAIPERVRSLCPQIMFFFSVLLCFFDIMQLLSRDSLTGHSLYVNKYQMVVWSRDSVTTERVVKRRFFRFAFFFFFNSWIELKALAMQAELCPGREILYFSWFSCVCLTGKKCHLWINKNTHGRRNHHIGPEQESSTSTLMPGLF